MKKGPSTDRWYVMIGKQYLLDLQCWLVDPDQASLVVSRTPEGAEHLHISNEANMVCTAIRRQPEVEDMVKLKLGIRRVTTTDYTPS